MIRNQNQNVDEVSIGLAMVIVGLLLILFAPALSDFFNVPREATGYEDKNTRLPTSVPPQTFFQIGIILAVIGFLVFSKHLVNINVEKLKWKISK